MTLDETRPRKQRLHALWSLAASESVHSTFLKQLLAAKDPTFRAFALRMAAKTGGLEWLRQDQDTLMALAKDSSREVQLQVAIAARRLKITAMQLGFISEFDLDAMPILFNVLTHCGDDKLIPHIVWPNLHPLLE